MFLGPSVSPKVSALVCQRLRQQTAFSAFRAVCTLGLTSGANQTSESSFVTTSNLQSFAFGSQGRGLRPMPWATSLSCGGFFPAPHHNDKWRHRLQAAQTHLQRLAPYAAGLATTIECERIARQQVGRFNRRRRQALNQGISFAVTVTPASMQQTGQASTSSSSSDADQHTSGGPAGVTNK